MATNTASAIFGRSHENDGGLAGKMAHNPFLRLSENSRPCWGFRPGDYFEAQGNPPLTRLRPEYLLIPTLEHALDDGLMLMALVLHHDAPWGAETARIRDQILNSGRITMYDLRPELRAEAREEIREYSSNFLKMILSVFQLDSLIHSRIDALTHYQHEMSVCMPVFTRTHSRWSTAPQEAGRLEGVLQRDA